MVFHFFNNSSIVFKSEFNKFNNSANVFTRTILIITFKSKSMAQQNQHCSYVDVRSMKLDSSDQEPSEQSNKSTENIDQQQQQQQHQQTQNNYDNYNVNFNNSIMNPSYSYYNNHRQYFLPYNHYQFHAYRPVNQVPNWYNQYYSNYYYSNYYSNYNYYPSGSYLTRRHYTRDRPHYKKREEIKSLVKSFRKWNMINKDNSNDDDLPCLSSLKFKLMTYNVLSQNLLDDNYYLYRFCQRESLNWPERGQRILQELKNSQADIICLQEVHVDHYEEFYKPELEKIGYNTIYKKKTGSKFDGCAIIYNPIKFQVEHMIKLEFFRKDISLSLDRDNVALIIIFKPKIVPNSNETKLIIANTHLLYNPKRGDVKLAQLRLLLAEIDKVAIKCKNDNGDIIYHPIILCGDMNSEPDSPLYSFIINGQANFQGIRNGDISGQLEGRNRGNIISQSQLSVRGLSNDSKYITEDEEEKEENQIKSQPDSTKSDQSNDKSQIFSHRFNFQSVYPKDKSLVSIKLAYELGLVDYIFYSKNDKLKLLGYKKLLTHGQLDTIGNLPNSYLGSDHLSLIAKFLITC